MCLKQDYSSRFRILKGGKISLVVSAILGSAIIANASPSDGVVTSGSATISQSGNTTNINQSTNKASINWKDFSISSNETVNFNQPNVNSITLNRVVGNEKSIIDGALNANGQVWILNSNGILFNSSAKVNTSGLVATTKELSDADFQSGNYNFKGESKASVINLGTIEVTNNSYVVLASNEVKNSGTIKAVKGKVYLSGASEYTINLNGNSIVDLVVSKGVLDAMVENSGTIIANGGEIYLTTNAVNELLKGVVNNSGVLEANSLDGLTGKVEVFAHGGTTNVSGTIEAKEGFVETSGKNLNITNSAKVTANKWLLDPTNITIESNGGSIGNESVSATAIQNALSTTNVELQADEDITVNENITWSTNKQLKLSAGDEIYVNAIINNTNSTNGGVYFNAANMDDKVIFGTNGKVVINNVYQLQWVDTALRGKYELGSDIDASVTSTWNNGAGFDPLFNTYLYSDPNEPNMGYYNMLAYFRGTFDGNNHTISNLYINRPDETNGIGLFGSTNEATIKNLGLINVNFSGASGNGDVAGGLIGGAQNTTIENTYVTGTVTTLGNSSVGGLVGDASNTTIRNSYSTANITGGNCVGGLVGNLYNSSITNSYSTGLVSGNGNVWAIGGLVGNSNSTITNSYWNTETSGQSTSAGGTGLTSAQFTNSSNFISWDSSIWAFSGNDFEGFASNVITSPVLRALFSPTILFEGGYGTSSNPYTITNWTQLQNINNSNILTLNYYFKLLNNLSSSTSDYASQASSSANSNKGWNPLGNSSYKFTGTFDGNNYTISNLYMNYSGFPIEGVGLFGYTSNSSTIKNLGVTDVNIRGYDQKVGSLVGYNFGLITNSFSTGTLRGGSNVGGLVGTNAGTIEKSYSTSTVDGWNRVGGLVGVNSSIIRESYSNTDVYANHGQNIVGGLVGENSGSVTNSYSIGDVNTNASDVGGLIGKNTGTVSNVYSTGKATGSLRVGGLMGSNYSSNVTNTFWDSNTSQKSNAIGYDAANKTVTEINSSNAFNQSTYSGFDFTNYWYMIDGETRPYLRSEYSTIIRNINQLQLMNMNLGASYSLANNIIYSSDMFTSKGFFSIGNSSSKFTGTFDGNNYTISNLFINRSSDNIGLFGYTNNATISDVGLTNVDITGNSQTGALVGYNYNSIINNSFSSGTVESTGDNSGGLVGRNEGNNSEINNSYSSVNLTATGTNSNRTGGLVGWNFEGAKVKNSYAMGNVSGVLGVGGLVGSNENNSRIENSYSIGRVIGSNYIGGLVGWNNATINNSFWDKETSEQTTSAGGTGLTTAQFANLSNYSSWDSSIWELLSDSSIAGYGVYRPYLKNVTLSNDKKIITLFQGGYGTETNPYTITNWTQLQNLNNSSILNNSTNNYYYSLLNNLNSNTSDYNSIASSNANNGAGWNPIGDFYKLFYGKFDGNDYTISDLYIYRPTTWFVGLFGRVGDNSIITNLGVTNSNVTGYNYVGALIGQNNGRNSLVQYSYSSGTVSAMDIIIGGLIGESYGRTSNTYSTATVYGNNYIGGLVGGNHGFVENSYSTDTNHNVIGINDGGTDSNSFWLTLDNNSVYSGSGSSALTSEEFKNILNFSNNGWNITTNSSLSTSLTAPILVTNNGVTSWIMPAYTTYISYALSTISNGYTYSGNEVLLSSLWNSNTIFGSRYSSWILGTDYNFMYNGNVITSFTNAGTYSGIYIDILKSGFDISNSGNTNGTLTITPKAITVVANDVTKTYGDNNPNLTYSLDNNSSLVGEDSLSSLISGSLNTNATTNSNVGSYTVSTSNLSDISSNYDITFNDGTLTITPKAITIYYEGIDKEYDGSSLASVRKGISGVINSDDISISESTYFIDANAGENKTINISNIVISGEDSLNYEISSNTDTSTAATITPKAITVVANDVSKTYGDNNPNLTYEITSGNLVGEDSLSGSLSTNATTNSNVGTYTITSSLSNSNYDITYTNGTLTITPKAITVVANDVTKTYGDNNPNLTYSLDNNSSLVGEDSLSSLISGSLNTNATTNSNVGSYTVSTSNLSDISSNYDITFNDGTLTITPKAITVVANDVSKTYGDNNPNLTYEITSGNLVGEDSLSGSLSTNATTNSNVGTYTITSSLSNSNYDITYTNGTLTITPKAITVVANDVSKTYGDNNPSLTYSLDSNSSLVGEDSLSSLISGSLNTNATTNSNVGSYTVSTSNLNDITSNYDITFNDGTLTITPKAIISQTSLPQQINQVTGIPLEVSQLLNNELISLGTNLLVLDKSNENVTTLALNGKLQPGKYRVTAVNDNSNYSLNLNEVELIITEAIDPSNIIKIQTTLPQTPLGNIEITNNQNSNSSTPSINNANTVIALNNNSSIELINGGIKLPIGLNQIETGDNN